MWRKGAEDQDERDRVLEMGLRAKKKRVSKAKEKDSKGGEGPESESSSKDPKQDIDPDAGKQAPVVSVVINKNPNEN